MMLEDEIASWQEYRRALRPDDQKVFDIVMAAAVKRENAANKMHRIVESEVLFLTCLLNIQKELQILKVEVSRLKRNKESSITDLFVPILIFFLFPNATTFCRMCNYLGSGTIQSIKVKKVKKIQTWWLQ